MARRAREEPGTFDKIAAAATDVQTLRNLQDLGLIRHGTIRNPNYYQNLLAQGHTVDPATGLDIPKKEVARFTGSRARKQVAAGGDPSVVPPARGSATIYNPYAFPATLGPPGSEGFQEVQRANARQHSALPFAEVQRQFQDVLLGRNAAPSALTGAGATSKFAEQTQEQRELADAIRPHFTMRDKQAAADAVAILKAASEPGVFGSDIANLKQQFAAKYPEHEALLESMERPMSREQIQQLEDMQTTEQFRDNFEAMGVPRDLVLGIERDKDGNIKPNAPMVDTWFRAQTEGRKQDIEAGRDERAFNMDQLREHRKTDRPEIPTFQELALLGSEKEKMDAIRSAEALQKIWDDTEEDLEVKAFNRSPKAAARAANPVPEQTPLHEQAQAKGVQFFRPETIEQIGAGIESGGWQEGAIVEWEGASYELVKTKNGGLKLFPLQ